MPELPAWVDEPVAEGGNVWAPAVIARGHGGYLLYFVRPLGEPARPVPLTQAVHRHRRHALLALQREPRG
ncbi:MAG: hypothetical protein DLM62_20445 [Pseudonocardiales bacterium]|nr:MAG: hypothetical protein DLM62_20445 [Pseudonocardiales bacterium]